MDGLTCHPLISLGSDVPAASRPTVPSSLFKTMLVVPPGRMQHMFDQKYVCVSF